MANKYMKKMLSEIIPPYSTYSGYYQKMRSAGKNLHNTGSHYGKQLKVLPKNKNTTTVQTSNPVLDTSKRYLLSHVHFSTIHSSQDVESMVINRQMHKENVLSYTYLI
jgi:hypothetical protein